MILKKHREYDFTKSENYYIIVSDNEKNMYNDLHNFCELHKNENVFYYVNPIRPSKVNYRPEYSMEVVISNNDSCLMLYRIAQRKGDNKNA